MDVPSIMYYAKMKGLNILGTGDFTQPDWRKHLRSNLSQVGSTGLYATEKDPSIRFIFTSEICTIFQFSGKTRKIHHLILSPSFEVAEQISDRLTRFGDLESDGRPTLSVSAPELVELIMETSRENMIIPAHAWTPWFSLFGSISGFDRIEDCYQDAIRHIYALETGLSSDPPMNWRLSSLDRFILISNSDAHSPYPYRLGRESNAFILKDLTYSSVVGALRRDGTNILVFTVETEPAYGKYHWSGHRRCNFSASAEESRRLKGICPVCHRPLTRGVEERVEDLADRKAGFKPGRAAGFRHLLPLQEIIAKVMGIDSETSSAVWNNYVALVTRFGSEYKVLLNATKEEMVKITDARVAEAVLKVRHDDAVVIPGYDGVYGVLDLKAAKVKTNIYEDRGLHCQVQLTDFISSRKDITD
ncbi:endonuclease Q family protein [Candidatus Bathyarchaeota archaeon]|nr:endonuclease Q family protein [Candidatus Bathyarchaeota archaeon]